MCLHVQTDSALHLTNRAEARGNLTATQADLLRAMIYENQSMFQLEERCLRRALADTLRPSPSASVTPW